MDHLLKIYYVHASRAYQQSMAKTDALVSAPSAVTLEENEKPRDAWPQPYTSEAIESFESTKAALNPTLLNACMDELPQKDLIQAVRELNLILRAEKNAKKYENYFPVMSLDSSIQMSSDEPGRLDSIYTEVGSLTLQDGDTIANSAQTPGTEETSVKLEVSNPPQLDFSKPAEFLDNSSAPLAEAAKDSHSVPNSTHSSISTLDRAPFAVSLNTPDRSLSTRLQNQSDAGLEEIGDAPILNFDKDDGPSINLSTVDKSNSSDEEAEHCLDKSSVDLYELAPQLHFEVAERAFFRGLENLSASGTMQTPTTRYDPPPPPPVPLHIDPVSQKSQKYQPGPSSPTMSPRAPHDLMCMKPQCKKRADMICPVCQDQSIDQPLVVCSQECLDSVWQSHKPQHEQKVTLSVSESDLNDLHTICPCGRPAQLKCPLCPKENAPVVCSQECFENTWPVHSQLHLKANMNSERSLLDIFDTSPSSATKIDLCKRLGCFKIAILDCPECIKSKLPVYSTCSQECFELIWSSHSMEFHPTLGQKSEDLKNAEEPVQVENKQFTNKTHAARVLMHQLSYLQKKDVEGVFQPMVIAAGVRNQIPGYLMARRLFSEDIMVAIYKLPWYKYLHLDWRNILGYVLTVLLITGCSMLALVYAVVC